MSRRTSAASPKPPAHLRPETRRWWQSVVESYELEPHHVRVLTSAARAWDQAEAAAELVRNEGLIVVMPSGAARPHPAIRIGNEASALFLRSVRELDLDVDPPAAAARPPQLRSIVGGRG